MTILALIWQRKVLPYLGTVLRRMCVSVFLLSLTFFALHRLTPQDYQGCLSGPLGEALARIIDVVFSLFLLARMVTYWFTGPQSIFLCVAIAILFFTAVKVFRLRFIRSGQTTVRVDQNSIVVSRNWLHLYFYETTIKWYELALVSLKTNKTGGKTEELLSFATTNGKKIDLDAGCLNDARLRANLIALIKRYAPAALSNELEQMITGNTWTKVFFKMGTYETAEAAANIIGKTKQGSRRPGYKCGVQVEGQRQSGSRGREGGRKKERAFHGAICGVMAAGCRRQRQGRCWGEAGGRHPHLTAGCCVPCLHRRRRCQPSCR